MDTASLLELDRQHLWHPYASVTTPPTVYPVSHADGALLHLTDGRSLIDGMSSWWSVLHGYNHPALNQAIRQQLDKVAHVMFGGLTHEPAVTLAQKLVTITPAGLSRVFFSDSGSVSVEVALKMALQYWRSRAQPDKHRFLALRNGYHGDTFGAMSVCDPIAGMHHLFADAMPAQVFAPAPAARFGESCSASELAALERLFAEHHQQLAAFILEPIVQGAGGMRFYSADYLRHARALCDRYQVLLIADEIATGFARTGKLFACEHAGISPDIMTLGKGLTGGYMTLAATLCNDEVAQGICNGEAGVFMHGPTFMANPLACAVANASIDVLLNQDWRAEVLRIEAALTKGLAPCAALPDVAEVRVLGTIGVVEMKEPVKTAEIQGRFVDRGVWVRPFGKLVYLMPPLVISDQQLHQLTGAMVDILSNPAALAPEGDDFSMV